MLYTYVTEQCYEDAQRIGTVGDVEKLKEKLLKEQSTLGLQRHPMPFLKKRIGRTRLIVAEVFDGEDVVLCFLRHVYKHEIGNDYNGFFNSLRVPTIEDEGLASFLKDARTKPIKTRESLTNQELEYLIIDRDHEMGEMSILESPLWIEAIKEIKDTPGKQGLLAPVWEILGKICGAIGEDNGIGCERKHDNYDLRVLFRYFPEQRSLLLIAPLEGDERAGESNPIVLKADDLLQESSHFEEHDLLQNAARAYPDFVVYDREIWESTQASIDANLALSPEESDVLAHVLDPSLKGGFPLFINGRPGSGKSTILQYLFAEYLHKHLARPRDTRLSHPPLYLTYNERLLDNARQLVEDIFRCGAGKLASSDIVDLQDADQKEEFKGSFVYFREFLLSLLKDHVFDKTKYVDFHKFRSLYVTVLQGPDPKLRRLDPEVAWHTLRTYIKGRSTGEADYFDPEGYAELPRDEITVTSDTYELVWDKVWNGWYKDLCEKEGYWDDQDLARKVLDQDLVPAQYPGVFCDEAQDFTNMELELIFRLSRYTNKHVDPYYQMLIPFVFAGDPFQTLNPTGFRWDAIKANFHDNIVRQLDPDQRGKVEMTFKELAYNYRSTTSIVCFCNLLQLKRAELFNIPDVTPQKSWSIIEGARPAYFDLDLGVQGKLKEQSELIIVVPCQEGEEKAFVEDDDYLRTIALDSKGNVVRSVLSPMRAKGLEFGRVVLYKFGEHAVRDGHVDVMEQISEEEQGRLAREQTLGLEYFFNGTYVGASRAQRRLLVVDTIDGLERFWGFATDTGEIGELLTDKRLSSWTAEDLHHMMRGDPTTWAEDRDDPTALATRFFEQGALERDAYLLQLAKNQFESFGDQEKTARCAALIHDINGEYPEAAIVYERLGEFADAIRCHWESRSYKKASEIAARDLGRFGNSPFVIAARYLNGDRTSEDAGEFLQLLNDAPADLISRQFECSHWTDVFREAVSSLIGDGPTSFEVGSEACKDALRTLMRLEKNFGLRLNRSAELAALAFMAQDYVTVLEIWEEVSHHFGTKEPDFVLQARARRDPYPYSLQWYSKLGDHQSIARAYEGNESIELEEDQRKYIIEALLEEKRYEKVVELIKGKGALGEMRYLLRNLPATKSARNAVRPLLGQYILTSIREGKYRQIIDDLRRDKSEIQLLRSLISDDKILSAAEAALIRFIARDQGLVEETSEQKYVSGRIRAMAKKRANKLQEFLGAEEVGAALERAGRMDNALSFYETVYTSNMWGENRGTEYNAKARWLKCKERQANLGDRNQKRRNQRLSEAKQRSVDWGLLVPDEEFPTLPKLEISEIDDMFIGDRTTKVPKIVKGENQDDAFHEIESTTDEGKFRLEGEQVQPDLLETRLDRSKEEAPLESYFPIIIDRPAFNGKIELTCQCGSVNMETIVLPGKHRLEIRDKDTSDLVMVYAKDGAVDSRDLDIVGTDSNTWRVKEWSLDIQFIDMASDATLVDFSDSENNRILCLLV